MAIVLGTRIATLGTGWQRVTQRSQFSNGQVYVRLNTQNAVLGAGITSNSAPASDDLMSSKVFVADPPAG